MLLELVQKKVQDVSACRYLSLPVTLQNWNQLFLNK